MITPPSTFGHVMTLSNQLRTSSAVSCELLLINTQLQNDRFQYVPDI